MKLKKFLTCIIACSTLMLCSCSGAQSSSVSEKDSETSTSKNESETTVDAESEATSETTPKTTKATTAKPTLTEPPEAPYLTLIGHSSVKIKTSDGKVIYIDPAYTKFDKAYSEPADLILVTHGHDDHNKISLVEAKDTCQTISYATAHPEKDEYKSFDVEGIKIDTVAAENSNHDILYCVGYVLTFDGISVYHAGDTSTLDIINEQLKGRTIDYALYPTDGVYNMSASEATAFADSIGAKNNIPMHISEFNAAYNEETAKAFAPQNAMYIEYGNSIALEKK